MRRTDPARNMARFYLLDVQKDLFGEIVATRSWGRMGTFGRSKTEVFPCEEAAWREVARLERRKIRRGYERLPSAQA